MAFNSRASTTSKRKKEFSLEISRTITGGTTIQREVTKNVVHLRSRVTRKELGRTFECRKRSVCATHDLMKIRVRVLRSKDVLEKCKKGRLFLVVGAERDSSCKPLLATSYTESSLAFAAYRRYTFLGRAHLAKSRTM